MTTGAVLTVTVTVVAVLLLGAAAPRASSTAQPAHRGVTGFSPRPAAMVATAGERPCGSHSCAVTGGHHDGVAGPHKR
jgi:hypothetical protein